MTLPFTESTQAYAAPPRLAKERKFIAAERSADRATELFDRLLLPDGDYPVNTINSIYYETLDLRAFAEKADGDNLKHKVRLRWYSASGPEAPAGTRAFLEVKFRIGSARHKMRQELLLDRAWLERAALTDPELVRVLKRAEGPLAPWMSPALRPAVCISYERRRYRCPYTGGRVAVDRAIRAGRFHPDQFPLGVPLRIDATVCEFKDAAQADIPWACHLYEAGFRLRSFSKFGEAIRLLQLGGAPA